MGIRILIAALLSFALILVPSEKAFNNSETKAVVAVAGTETGATNGTSGQMRQQRADGHRLEARNLLTDKDGEQVAKLQATTPAQGSGAKQEKPESRPRVADRTTDKPSEPAPQQTKVTQAPGCEKYRDIIDNYSWNVSVAIAVCNAESSGNANTANLNDYHSFAGCRGSFGLFQINCSHGKVYDPVENIRIAAAMYEASGWRPWAATTCKYKVSCH